MSNHHKNIIFPSSRCYFVEHTNKSASAHPLPTVPTQLTPLTLLTPINLSHSSSFTITPMPPTPSTFPDHHNLNLFSSMLNIQKPCHLHLTQCKPYTSTIFLPTFVHTISPSSTKPPIFHMPTHIPKRQSGLSHNASYACSHQDETLHHLTINESMCYQSHPLD